jgi:hypothetical protein
MTIEISSAQFTEQVLKHKENRTVVMSALPPRIADLCEQTQSSVRDILKVKPNDVVVVLGEQTYGFNEPPKVIGKRILAKDMEINHGVTAIELFASYDVVSSEGGIYRMQIPHANAKEGVVSVNMLPGWKHKKHVSTVGFQTPTPEEMTAAMDTLSGIYGPTKSENLRAFYEKHNSSNHNYAEANAVILRDFEQQIGLQIQRYVYENTLDTHIAANGGMEVMLYLWPRLLKEAQQFQTSEVRVPDINETPFFIYHTDNNCGGRMKSFFIDTETELNLESQIASRCMQCGHDETSSPGNLLETGRQLTWRAIPRVIAYSTLGVADGHITGGGSVYNGIAQQASDNIGLDYFPIVHMSKVDEHGEKTGIFNYPSAALSKAKGPNLKQAETFVKEGRAAMTDLIMSVGVSQLKEKLKESLDTGISTNVKFYFEETIPRYSQVIEI